MSSKNDQANKIASQILDFARNELLVALRFMDMALCKLEYEPLYDDPDFSISTNGRIIKINPAFIFKKYKISKEEVCRLYLHMVLHCIFYHPFVSKDINRSVWNLCCDIAVENIINELGIKQTATSQKKQQEAEILILSQNVKKITAEKLYKHFINSNISNFEISRLSKIFLQDSHVLWYIEEQSKDSQNVNNNSNDKSKKENGNDEKGQSLNKEQGTSRNSTVVSSAFPEWQNISERAQIDLETASKSWGDKAGNLVKNIKEVNREKYDYAGFLKKFAVLGEDMQINDDEFDYIYYTYGLKVFGNLPLVEPLEYKEVKKIKEFVVAIDTSGSVQGKLVESFITKTYNILMQEENFFSKINIHIIQCDTEVQSDIKITSKEEFESAIKNLELRGFGGTDFRPVFEYVDELRRKGEFTNLRGLIYFTDGYGIFPEKKTDYDTAFVFIGDEDFQHNIPMWAIKLVLEPEEI